MTQLYVTLTPSRDVPIDFPTQYVVDYEGTASQLLALMTYEPSRIAFGDEQIAVSLPAEDVRSILVTQLPPTIQADTSLDFGEPPEAAGWPPLLRGQWMQVIARQCYALADHLHPWDLASPDLTDDYLRAVSEIDPATVRDVQAADPFHRGPS